MRPVIIFDIDGTLADCEHRLHHILEEVPKNWPAFDSKIMDDTPIENMLDINSMVAWNPDIDILLLTGRNERVRDKTEEWLDLYYICYDHLEMRGEHDFRPADVIKLERLVKLGYAPEDVITIFEDDPKVTTTLREAGYHVCCVDDRPYEEALQEGGREIYPNQPLQENTNETITSRDGSSVLPTEHP